jgi:hypothetical protein
MAERLSQYSMMPNFNPGIMQSQQQQAQSQQQQQQQQEPLHSAMQGFPDQSRMWQQIQHQQMQQYRTGGADLNQQQPSAQASCSLLPSHVLPIRPIYLHPVPLGPLLLCMWAALLTTHLSISCCLIFFSTHILSRYLRSRTCLTSFPLSYVNRS